jgi:preprotein translocase subunit SecF
MYTTIFIVFGVIVLLVFLLTKLSPFESDFTSDSLVINDEKQENVKYVEVEKIVEKIVEKPIEVKQYEIYEDIDRILELEEKIKELENKPQEGKVYRNIGLELYQEREKKYKLSDIKIFINERSKNTLSSVIQQVVKFNKRKFL